MHCHDHKCSCELCMQPGMIENSLPSLQAAAAATQTRLVGRRHFLPLFLQPLFDPAFEGNVKKNLESCFDHRLLN